MPKIAVVTLDGFNEIDSFVASYMLGRVNRPGWSVSIACPSPQVTSMNGLTINAQMSLDELPTADAVIVGSGMKTREYAADPAFLASLRLDPARQISGSQCSGALILAKRGSSRPARTSSTDHSSPPAMSRRPGDACRASTSQRG